MAEDSTIILNAGEAAQGEIRLAPRVLEFIAGIAASQVEGVSKLRGSFANNVSELLGRSDHRRGVKLTVKDDQLTLDLAVTLDYGATVPKVAAQIQERVKQQVALMTNLSVAAVNVHVQGIMPEKEPQAALDPDKLFEEEESNGEE